MSRGYSGKRKFSQDKGSPAVEWFITTQCPSAQLYICVTGKLPVESVHLFCTLRLTTGLRCLLADVTNLHLWIHSRWDRNSAIYLEGMQVHYSHMCTLGWMSFFSYKYPYNLSLRAFWARWPHRKHHPGRVNPMHLPVPSSTTPSTKIGWISSYLKLRGIRLLNIFAICFKFPMSKCYVRLSSCTFNLINRDAATRWGRARHSDWYENSFIMVVYEKKILVVP